MCAGLSGGRRALESRGQGRLTKFRWPDGLDGQTRRSGDFKQGENDRDEREPEERSSVRSGVREEHQQQRGDDCQCSNCLDDPALEGAVHADSGMALV